MDKSRSSRNKTDFPKKNKSENNLPKIDGKKVSVNQKEGKGNRLLKKMCNFAKNLFYGRNAFVLSLFF